MQIAFPAVVCALALPLGAQQVFIVDQAGGPGVYTGVQAALDAGADDGDVILVREGGYAAFAIDGQGVSVVADTGATPIFVGSVDSLGDPCVPITGLDADDVVVLRGLEFDQFIPLGIPGTLVEVSGGGTVLLEECILKDGRPCLRAGPGTNVALERCTLEGLAGVYATFFFSYGPGAGIVVEGEVALHGSSAQGGKGNDGFYDGLHSFPAQAGEDAVRISGAGALFLADSELLGGTGGDGYTEFECKPPGTGGAGLHLAAGAPVARLAGATLTGGLAGAPFGFCPPGASGPALLHEAGTVEDLGAPGPRLAVDGVAREGQTLLGTIAGEPGALALLAAGAPLLEYLPSVQGALLVFPQQVFALGTIPPSGVLNLSAPVGELGAGVSAVQVMLQGAACGTAGCVLGAGSHTVLLDAAF